MIIYKAKEGKVVTKFPIQTSWKEVMYDKYIQWINHIADQEFMADPIRVLEFQSDVPADFLRRMPMTRAAEIADLCSFFNDFDALNIWNIVPEEFKSIEIAKMPWGHYERSKQAIAANKGHFFGAGAAVIEIYCGIDIRQKPITESIGLLNFFFHNSGLSRIASND